MIELREYQRKAVLDVGDAWREGKTPILVQPTGAGKSIIIAEVVRLLRAKNTKRRCLVIAHRKELLEQNADKLRKLGMDVGIYSAGLGRKDLEHAVICAGIQSIGKEIYWEAEAVILDECHRVDKENQGLYRSLIEASSAKFIVGLTATPWRLGRGYNNLAIGGNSVFTDVIWGPKIGELQGQGFLCKLVTRCSKVKMNCERIEKKAGDFTIGSAEREAIFVADDAIEDMKLKAEFRKKCVVFTPGVQSAEKISDALSGFGGSALVTAKTSATDRAAAVKGFRDGAFKWLVNCQVFTEGYDEPEIDCIVVLRPTQSATLHCQMIGRGLRSAPGKEDCLVLDYAGNSERFGPLDSIDFERMHERPLGKRTHGMCPMCEAPLAYGEHVCACGYERPGGKIRKDRASEAFEGDVVSGDPILLTVYNTRIEPYMSKKGNPSIKMSYRTAAGVVCEWIPVARSGVQAARMQEFFQEWCGFTYWPAGEQDAAEFLMRNAKKEPRQIRVRRKGPKFFQMMRVTEWKDVEKETKTFDSALAIIEELFPTSRITW